jgi:hypothetical protein
LKIDGFHLLSSHLWMFSFATDLSPVMPHPLISEAARPLLHSAMLGVIRPTDPLLRTDEDEEPTMRLLVASKSDENCSVTVKK